MLLFRRVLAILGAGLGLAAPASAQIDYRNLDDDRPTLIEDAYPIERYAFELLTPWRFSRDRLGGTMHAFVPELAVGAFPNAHFGLKLPVAGVSSGTGREWGIAGLRVFGLYNFNTESRTLPAFSVRADLNLPVGRLAGEGTRVSIKGLATRSWGRTRFHVNGAYTFGADRMLGAADPANKWWYGGAVDRTLFRQSILLVGEVYALRHLSDDPVQVNASLGLRVQLTPYLVFDAGAARRLRAEGPDLELTAGFSHAFAIAGFLPTGGRP